MPVNRRYDHAPYRTTYERTRSWAGRNLVGPALGAGTELTLSGGYPSIVTALFAGGGWLLNYLIAQNIIGRSAENRAATLQDRLFQAEERIRQQSSALAATPPAVGPNGFTQKLMRSSSADEDIQIEIEKCLDLGRKTYSTFLSKGKHLRRSFRLIKNPEEKKRAIVQWNKGMCEKFGANIPENIKLYFERFIGEDQGEYIVLGQLGQGGQGVVMALMKYEDFDVKNPLYLVKIGHNVERIIIEGEEQSRLAQYINSLDERGLAKLAVPQKIFRLCNAAIMDYMDGIPLVDVINMAKRLPKLLEEAHLSVDLPYPCLPPGFCLDVFATLVRTFKYIHPSHLHRDLKPANLLLTGVSPTFMAILDFGLVRGAKSQGETQMGLVMGTPEYMAPEIPQLGSRHSGPAADIFAMGAMLFEMLTGQAIIHIPEKDRDNAKIIFEALILRIPQLPDIILDDARLLKYLGSEKLDQFAELVLETTKIDCDDRITIPDLLIHPLLAGRNGGSHGTV